YDALHFAHLRTGSRLAGRLDRASRARVIPALRAELERHPADLVVSVFATGASAAARLKAEIPDLRTVAFPTADASADNVFNYYLVSPSGTVVATATTPQTVNGQAVGDAELSTASPTAG